MTPPSGGVTLQDASDGTLVLPANLSLERCEPSAKSSLEALWLTAPLKPSDVQVEIGPHASEEARLEPAGDSEMGVCVLSNDSGWGKASLPRAITMAML